MSIVSDEPPVLPDLGDESKNVKELAEIEELLDEDFRLVADSKNSWRWYDKEDAVTIETRDGHTMQFSKRRLASESLFFQALFNYPPRDPVCLSIDYAELKACLTYLEALDRNLTPKLTMQEAINLFETSAYLLLDNAMDSLSTFILDEVDEFNLIPMYRMALVRYPPMSDKLWNLVLLRFRELYYNDEYLLLDDMELSMALLDRRLSLQPKEEASVIKEWLATHTLNNERVSQIQRDRLRNRPNDGRMLYPVVRNRVPANLVMCIGGWGADGATNVIECFNERSNRWIKASTMYMPSSSVAYHATVVTGKKMLLYGGFNGAEHFHICREFDLSTGIWSQKRSMIERRCYLASSNFTDSNGSNKAIAIGGFNGFSRLPTAEVYDVEKDWWTPLPHMSKSRSDLACTMLGTTIFAAGGFDGQDVHRDCEMFDFGAAKWYAPTNRSMSAARSGVSAVTYDEHVAIVLGGYSGGRRLRTAEFMDTREGQWHSMPNFDTPRSNFGATTLGEYIYLAGGYTGNSTTKNCERLDMRKLVWENITPLSVNKSALKLVRLSHHSLISPLIQFIDDSGLPHHDAPPYH